MIKYRLYLNDGKEFIQDFDDNDQIGSPAEQVRALYLFAMINDYDREPETAVTGFVIPPDPEQPAQ